MNMKTWNNYFGKKEEQINEDHKVGKKEQVEFICDVVNKLDEKDVEKLYKYIEDKFDVK